MEAAIIASSRGHQVTLCEKEPELGSSLRYAAGPSFKADTRKYLDWIVGKTKRLPVELKLSCQVTADFVKKMKPDVLIMAVGASPIVPNIPGIEKPNVFNAGDVCFGKAVPGKEVVVAGAGLTGCEVAVELALQGKSITVVDIISESEIAQDAFGSRRSSILGLIKDNNVTVKTGMKLVQITDKGSTVIDKDSNYHEMPADAIVLSLGVEPCSDIVGALQGIVDETYTIGDCSRPGNIYQAVHDGFNTAVAI